MTTHRRLAVRPATAPAPRCPAHRPARPGIGGGWRGDRGSESVELAILLPVIALVLAMLVVGGRIALAGQRINGVADAAARAASIARTPAAAQQAAVSGAETALAAADLHCADVKVTVDVAGFAAPPGTPAAVTVNVWCTVDLTDIGAPGLPGSRTLHDRAASPLDLARG